MRVISPIVEYMNFAYAIMNKIGQKMAQYPPFRYEDLLELQFAKIIYIRFQKAYHPIVFHVAPNKMS